MKPPVGREELNECRRCELWRNATQGVPGQGGRAALVMLVGEQPGDEEDILGAPFVGPAGRLLDRALAEAGLDRSDVFLTNAVKHFKWQPRGKRRLHRKPSAREIMACHYWLEREIGSVRPRVILAMGTTALHALRGAAMTLTAARRKILPHPSGAALLATFHPSAALRAPDEAGRRQMFQTLVDDLRRAAALAASPES